MLDPDADKQPATLDELETQLDKSPADLPPPDPRAANPDALVRPPKDPDIDEAALKEAGNAAEEADEDEEPEEDLTKPGLHLEANPYAKPKPFWKRKRFWAALIFLLVLASLLAWFIRPSRLVIVNALGLRAPISIKTGTVPEAGQESALLKNVSLTINGEAVQTGDQSELKTTARYGQTNVVAKKAGFEEKSHTFMLDFDPFFYLLGGKKADDEARNLHFTLKAVGITLKFQAKDWLSDTPLTAGTFSVGDVVAKANDQGIVQLAIPATDAKTVRVRATFGGSFIDKDFDVALDGSQPVITFVPAGKDYFVTNRSGGRAIYSSNVDGSEAVEVVPASPLETSSLTFTASPSGKYGVLASTRDGKKDAQNVLLQQVYVVDLATKKLTSVDSGQWVNFVDWLGDTLVYTVGERQPGSSSVTQRLASVNVTSAKQTTLANAGSFGAARVGVDSVIYQANGDDSGNNPELRVVPVRGGGEKNLGYQVQQLAQLDHEKFAYRKADGSWSEYNINTSQSKNASAPANTDRAFLASTSQDGQTRLVVGSVDGKVALIARSVGNSQEKTIYSHADIAGPVRLVGAGVVVFRQGSANYAVSISGGEPKKITNVTVPTKAFTPPGGYFSLF
jgi:hypothetical protein